MKRVAIAVSRFNEEVTSRLLDSCLRTFKDEGWKETALKVVHVPGGFELPWTVNELARSGRYEAVIALGCVLKGETRQNDHISRSVVRSLHEVSLASRVPVILGVLTPDTEGQAMARTAGELDRGKEAALAALEMVALREELRGRRRLAREVALQALYVSDVSNTPAEESFAIVTRLDAGATDADTMEFARALALGAIGARERLDALIQERAENWAMNRMAAVDRNVLRLAAYELSDRPDTPVGVVIDEAIEIVRKYSAEEATRFVNGILDSLKSLRQPAKPKKPRAKKDAAPKAES